MLKKLMIVLALVSLTACSTFEKGTQVDSVTRYDTATKKTVTEKTERKLTQGTMKYLSKVDLAKTMCEISGESYKQFLVLSDTNVSFLPIIITDGKYVQLPEEARVVFNNTVNRPDATPFNMANCVTDVMKTGVERFFTSLYKDVFKLGRDLVPYGAGYAIADRVFDYVSDTQDTIAENTGDRTTVTGDNNRVATGDGSTFDERPGIPVEPVTLEDGSLGGDDEGSCEDQGGTVRAIIPVSDERPFEDINGAIDANGDGLVCSVPGGPSIDN